MQQAAFSAPGRFYRGNLHTHCTASDGALDWAEVCRRYRAEGYDFLCMSDHFLGRFDYPITDTTGARDGEAFTTLLGAEVHSGALANGELWHLLAVGLPADFAPSASPEFEPHPDQETGAEIAARCREAGAFVAIAHPEWYGLTLADAATIEAAHAVEIYNHGCHVECDRGFGTAILDGLLDAGWRLSACATDDAHFRPLAPGITPDHFGGWVMAKAAANDPDHLVEALKDGAYYASTGAELRDVRLEGDEIVVECSPAVRVMAVGARSVSEAVFGTSMTGARLPIARFRRGGWVRVTVMDAGGRRAWSNPIWFD